MLTGRLLEEDPSQLDWLVNQIRELSNLAFPPDEPAGDEGGAGVIQDMQLLTVKGPRSGLEC
jgi:hypothetical protein